MGHDNEIKTFDRADHKYQQSTGCSTDDRSEERYNIRHTDHNADQSGIRKLKYSHGNEADHADYDRINDLSGK